MISPKNLKMVALWTHKPLQGELPLKVGLKDVITKEDERFLIDSLLEYSEEDREEGLIGTLFCGDWRDAVTGWSLTRPNVKYAWIEKSKERKQRNTSQSKKRQQEEQSWKTKVEPRTYRYNPDNRTQFKPDQMILQKRQVDPSVQHHIDKVREHLERTLKHSDGVQECKKPEPLPAIKPSHGSSDIHEPMAKITPDEHEQHGQYAVTMTKPGRRHSIEGGVKSHNHLEMGDGDPSRFLRNGLGRQSDTKLLKHGKKYHKHKQSNNSQVHDTKAPVDLVTALGQKLNEILMEDKIKSQGGIVSLPLARKMQKSSVFGTPATNSYERFPATEISPMVDQPLKPLTKITPHQRQIYDDNEVIAITSSRQEKSAASVGTGFLGFPFYSDIANEESPNKDFIQIGISGQRVQSSKTQGNFSQRNSTSPSNSQINRKNHGSATKLHKLPLTHGNTDSSHQGQLTDKESAATLAASLMPGVSGRKIEVPNA